MICIIVFLPPIDRANSHRVSPPTSVRGNWRRARGSEPLVPTSVKSDKKASPSSEELPDLEDLWPFRCRTRTPLSSFFVFRTIITLAHHLAVLPSRTWKRLCPPVSVVSRSNLLFLIRYELVVAHRSGFADRQEHIIVMTL